MTVIDPIQTLLEQFGERATRNSDVLDRHGRDESFHASAPPDLVVFPGTNDEVASIVKQCADSDTPVIPFGLGTSLEGHVAALHGGVCVDLSMMNEVLEINPGDLDVRVQAGVTRKQLNAELARHGLFFPVDPGADATLGGMAATSASGTNAVRYGTMRENILGMTVVMPNGEIVQTGGRARKSASGYDLTRLFCGSEGTLGVITEVQLKVYGLPEAHSAGVCAFKTLAGAVDSVISIIQMGIPVARVEFLDEVQVRAVNAYSKLSYAELPTLFFEFHGTEASVIEQSESVAEITAEYGGGEFLWSTKQEEQNQLWQARHDAYYAGMALRPGCSGWPTDVCVPITRLTECIQLTRIDVEETGVIAPIVGHVGDGNFHLLLLVDTDNPDEMATAKGINDRLVKRAIEMGGTSTGEHGIGSGKLPYMALEHGASLDLMRQVKLAFDPKNIMNPGKVIDIS
ncbi:MAG: FAD-linked oxidase C-terminal domain-containing protein [Pseudomonadales bacterium]